MPPVGEGSRLGSPAGSDGPRGMASLQDQKAATAVSRLSKFNGIGSLFAGLVIIIAVGSLIGSGLLAEHHAVSVIGLPISIKFVAATIIVVVALAIIGLNLRNALTLLRPGRNAASMVSENSGTSAAHRHRTPHPSRDGFETDQLVGLQLLEPRPDASSADMELIDAVRLAVHESRTTAAASFATAVANHPDDIIKMYATFMAEHVLIHGRRLPTGAPERVSLSNPVKEFAMENGELVLKERDGPETFRNLTIKGDDFGLILDRLRASPFS